MTTVIKPLLTPLLPEVFIVLRISYHISIGGIASLSPCTYLILCKLGKDARN